MTVIRLVGQFTRRESLGKTYLHSLCQTDTDFASLEPGGGGQKREVFLQLEDRSIYHLELQRLFLHSVNRGEVLRHVVVDVFSITFIVFLTLQGLPFGWLQERKSVNRRQRNRLTPTIHMQGQDRPTAKVRSNVLVSMATDPADICP
jgi:hypothetical protein